MVQGGVKHHICAFFSTAAGASHRQTWPSAVGGYVSVLYNLKIFMGLYFREFRKVIGLCEKISS